MYWESSINTLQWYQNIGSEWSVHGACMKWNIHFSNLSHHICYKKLLWWRKSHLKKISRFFSNEQEIWQLSTTPLQTNIVHLKKPRNFGDGPSGFPKWHANVCNDRITRCMHDTKTHTQIMPCDLLVKLNMIKRLFTFLPEIFNAKTSIHLRYLGHGQFFQCVISMLIL